jgi:hypothetical protein
MILRFSEIWTFCWLVKTFTRLHGLDPADMQASCSCSLTWHASSAALVLHLSQPCPNDAAAVAISSPLYKLSAFATLEILHTP